jgi:ATP-binding cassette subfamily E protein 1
MGKDKEKRRSIAIVNRDKCDPSKCARECEKVCPVNKIGKECIKIVNIEEIGKKATIAEDMCIGERCGMCQSKCPRDAIRIINLPVQLNQATHRYGENEFELYKLAEPKIGHVCGLIGANGTGKSTVLSILAFNTLPNNGNYDNKVKPTLKEISQQFKGKALQNYFGVPKKVVLKSQHIGLLAKKADTKDMTVREILDKNSEIDKDELEKYVIVMSLNKLLERKIKQLSGGELQRLQCLLTIIRNADVYIFDEPTNYLDIKQRLIVADMITSKNHENNYIVVVEHDLSIVDYIADYIHMMYGQKTAYGVVSQPHSTNNGINVYLDGYIPGENMRIRDEAFSFKNLSKDMDEVEYELNKNKESKEKNESNKINREDSIQKMINSRILIDYPTMTKTFDNFSLEIEGGQFILNAGVTVLLGQNGGGKTTFLSLLAGKIKPDNNTELPNITVSYKPQHIEQNFMRKDQSVYEYLVSEIGNKIVDKEFKNDVLGPLEMSNIMDNRIEALSGGQMQVISIAVALGKAADLYLIDEPSAFLDSEIRIRVAKAIKNFAIHNQKSIFVVEHDMMMSISLANSLFGRVIIFSGEPGVKTKASQPMALKVGLNMFLKQLDVTFRQDLNNGRPRINKKKSKADREQKKANEHFYIDSA